MENGTAHYLGIAAVRHGFAQIRRLGGFPAVAAHTQAVTRWEDLIRFLAAICIDYQVLCVCLAKNAICIGC